MISIAQTTNITQFNTLIKPNYNIGLTNPLWNQGSLMTYDIGQINTNGGAFSLNFTNPGGAGYKGYPSSTIGAFKGGGNYIPGVATASGLPVRIADLNHDLRIKWKVSQLNATDIGDKWWSSINVIFDSTNIALEPLPENRDFDLVIELNRYEQENFVDVTSDSNVVYWYYARNTDSSLKTLDFNYNGTVYKWVVRYKFFNYPVGDPNFDKNDKVHIKFTPLFNSAVAPFLDHSLKKFIETSVNFLQNVNLTTAERNLANSKVGNPNLYVKNINAGYEVYTGAFTISNDYFYTVLDTNPPASPVNLIATQVSNQINLDWNDNTELDFNSYKIYRALNGGTYTLLAEDINTSDFIDVTCTVGNTYHYFVVADDRSYNISNASNIVSVTLTISNIEDFKNEINQLVVYPNPTKNNFRIESKLNIENVELYSLDGKLINLSKNGNLYKFTNVNSGIYNLNIKIENSIVNKILIID